MILKRYLVIALLLIAVKSEAQIAFVTAVDGGNNGGSTTSLTFSIDVGSGSDRGLAVGLTGGTGVEGDDISSVTFNGVGMTLVNKVLGPGSGGGAGRWVYLYALHAPSTGSHSVVVTAGSSHYLIATATAYTGVFQSSTLDASATGTTSAATDTVTTAVTSVTDNAWMIAVRNAYASGAFPTAGTGSTRREYDHALGANGIFDSNGVIHPAGSYSMSTTYGSTTLIGNAQVQAAWAPASGSPPASIHTLGSLGVGK